VSESTSGQPKCRERKAAYPVICGRRLLEQVALSQKGTSVCLTGCEANFGRKIASNALGSKRHCGSAGMPRNGVVQANIQISPYSNTPAATEHILVVAA
jgi:hypothetical protein